MLQDCNNKKVQYNKLIKSPDAHMTISRTKNPVRKSKIFFSLLSYHQECRPPLYAIMSLCHNNPYGQKAIHLIGCGLLGAIEICVYPAWSMTFSLLIMSHKWWEEKIEFLIRAVNTKSTVLKNTSV